MCYSVHFGVRSVVVNVFAAFHTFVFPACISAEICGMSTAVSINIDEATLTDNSTQGKVSLSARHLASFSIFTSPLKVL